MVWVLGWSLFLWFFLFFFLNDTATTEIYTLSLHDALPDLEGLKIGSWEFNPVKWIAQQSETGHPSTIIAGISVGLYSTVIPALAIVVGIFLANELAGLYGIGLAAVGMLSTLGITLATDAYGPVADNAGGIAEQAHLDPDVRERTDPLEDRKRVG